MSPILKMESKKKIAQNDLRKLMAEHKNKSKPVGKINNPLAKYNDAGQLMCILCKSIVRSETVWPVHLNSKQHKENIAEAKKLKEQTNNFTKVVKKRPSSPIQQTNVPDKKLKGILKNSTVSRNTLPKDFFEKPSVNKPNSEPAEEIKRAPLNLDLIKPEKPSPSVEELKTTDNDATEAIASTSEEAPIPEGFFDDPILDAKARNKEYKDPVEEEWEKFQKEIREEASQSAAIIAGEQEEATAERQIDEIDEQLRNWSRVLDLEVKKEETAKKISEQTEMSVDEEGNSSDSELDVEEFLDWRAKKLYR